MLESELVKQLKDYFLISLDISIVAYIFYRIYLILAKTRAVQLGIGLLVIILLVITAYTLNLEANIWLIQNLDEYVIITIIVILAPELRRLVAQISPGRLSVFMLPKSALRLDEIFEAVKALAGTKTGAIIVLARQTGLNNYIERGTRMEAVISSELIRSIFFPNSPLHDGAVIIDRGQIEAAACYLPMSDSRHLKKSHGARHRAALGITEESDALVIVVSEETGRITLCLDGRLISNVRLAYVRSIISEVMSGQPNYQFLIDEGVPDEVMAKLSGEDIEVLKMRLAEKSRTHVA